jgi:hypothetical protein
MRIITWPITKPALIQLEHKLQLQTPNAFSPEQLQELTNIQRQIIKLFAATLEHLAPAYFAKDPHHQIPVTMLLLGLLNWFSLWYQPRRASTEMNMPKWLPKYCWVA